MIPQPLYRRDPYLSEHDTAVLSHTAEGAVVCAESVFYPTGGGQPGDSGWLIWEGGRMPVATAVKAEEGAVALVPAEAGPMPAPGTAVRQVLDWDRRHRHMRLHTALHLLSVLIPLPVTGGAIGAHRARLDFDMPDPPADLLRLSAALNSLIDRDLQVSEDWIDDAALAANPQLIKTLSVRPPMGQGRVRLIRIGRGAGQVDLQPCGGTHVARTAEIGHVEILKIEKKGRINRRVTLGLMD